MSLELPISDMADVTVALQTIARRLRLSVTALIEAGGVSNGSLGSIATGRSRQKDLALLPLLRVLHPAGYELVGRVADPNGLLVTVERGAQFLVLGPDGGRLEVVVADLEGVGVLFNTMAAANHLSVTGLVKMTGVNSTSLVGVAKGTGDNGDVRLINMIRLVEMARFELLIRPVHQTRREARIALTSARRATTSV
jgi:hypothetical protein